MSLDVLYERGRGGITGMDISVMGGRSRLNRVEYMNG